MLKFVKELNIAITFVRLLKALSEL